MAGALSPAAAGGVWRAEGTTPSQIEAALGDLVEARHSEHGRYAPARVLNLVVVVDAKRRGEIGGRLEQVGRFHPSRTIVCAVEDGREALGAWASMACELPVDPGGLALCRERVEIEVGPQAVPALSSVVDPLLVPDLETLLWSPHGRPEALAALSDLADSVLFDSSDEPVPRDGLTRAANLARSARVVDLAWLRGAPWRERLAALFDPPRWRSASAELCSVEIRHHPHSAAAGILLAAWLASRLGWEVERLLAGSGMLAGRARSPAGEVRIVLRADPDLESPGLGGVGVEARSGLALRLDRGAGGLSAWRRTAEGEEAAWTILGASRGEGGILGEGIRQALLRSRLYGPALDRAVRMAS